MKNLQAGSTITNGSCAVRLESRSEKGTPGWVGIYVSLSSGNMTGVSVLVADFELGDWGPVPWEWTPIPGAPIEHRYAWREDMRSLRHETRAKVRT